MAVAENELTRWVRRLYGPGTRYRSARQLSLAAGLSESVASKVEERGSATADTIFKLARASNTDPLAPLVMAGWLSEGEASGDLTDEESQMIRKYRQLSPPFRRLLREVLEGFLAPGGQ